MVELEFESSYAVSVDLDVGIPMGNGILVDDLGEYIREKVWGK